MPFRVLDRYVYRELLPIFGLAVGVVTFLHVMDRLQDFSNMVVNGAPVELVFRTWALLLLSFITLTLPMGLLLAVVIAAGRLASELRRVLIGNERGPDPLQISTAPRARMIDDAGRQRTILKMTDGAIHESRPESPGWYRVTRFEDYETSLDIGSQVDEVEKKMGP